MCSDDYSNFHVFGYLIENLWLYSINMLFEAEDYDHFYTLRTSFNWLELIVGKCVMGDCWIMHDGV